ncbi:MAG TPA: hypothetical protein RMH99_03520 [Sandaracinaceae bacterium LLY-WYZ-13_1]|nr:hypothetical protein [Sandaracinaceae bacterium LLY-WYZ-13_1]
MQPGIESRLEDVEEVVVVGVEGPEGLFAAAPVALGLEARGRRVTLAVADAEADGWTLVDPAGRDWAASVAAWYGEQDRPVRVMRWDGRAPVARDGALALAVGGAGLLSPTGPVRERLEVLRRGPAVAAAVGLGAEAAQGIEPDEAWSRLTALASVGGLIGVESIARFDTAGRHFVELVEHVHHAAGPMAQSVMADTLRASLFGRHGRAPVSLTTRERPPRLGLGALLVLYVEPDELLGG